MLTRENGTCVVYGRDSKSCSPGLGEGSDSKKTGLEKWAGLILQDLECHDHRDWLSFSFPPVTQLACIPQPLSKLSPAM